VCSWELTNLSRPIGRGGVIGLVDRARIEGGGNEGGGGEWFAAGGGGGRGAIARGRVIEAWGGGGLIAGLGLAAITRGRVLFDDMDGGDRDEVDRYGGVAVA
jgi:hypothetical protein